MVIMLHVFNLDPFTHFMTKYPLNSQVKASIYTNLTDATLQENSVKQYSSKELKADSTVVSRKCIVSSIAHMA